MAAAPPTTRLSRDITPQDTSIPKTRGPRGISDIGPNENLRSRQREQGERTRKRHTQLIQKLADAEYGRAPLDFEAIQNILFYIGRHWVRWDNDLHTFITDPPPPLQVRVVDNIFRRLLTKRLARAIRQRGEWEAVPADADPKNEAKAEGYAQWLRYIWRQNRMDAKYAKLQQWAALCGTGWAYSFWDPNVGPMEPQFETNEDGSPALASKCQACQGLGRTVPDMRTPIGLVCEACKGMGGVPLVLPKRQGDVHIRVPSYFDVYVDPLAKDGADAEYYILRETVSVQEARRRHPTKKWMFTDSDTVTGMMVQGLGTLYLTPATSAAFVGTKSFQGRVELYTMFTKPSSRHPAGGVYVFTRNWLVAEFDNPEPDAGWHPFVPFVDIQLPGSVHGWATLTDTRNLNKHINRNHGQIIEHNSMVVSPPVQQAFNAVVSPNVNYPLPGHTQEYHQGIPGGKPEFMQVPRLDGSVLEHPSRLRAAAEENALVQTPQPDPRLAAKTVALVEEQMDKDNTMFIIQANDSLQRMGERALALGKRYITVERKMAVVGETNSAARTFIFEPDDNPFDRIDVVVSSNPVLPDSALARIEVIGTDVAPYLTDEMGMPDTDEILRMMQVKTATIDRRSIERQNAVRESEEMESTMQVLPVSPEDDHAVQIPEHQMIARKYPVGHPVRMVHEAHIAVHKQHLAQMQMAQMMARQQQVAGGNAPATPTAPGQTLAGDPAGMAGPQGGLPGGGNPSPQGPTAAPLQQQSAGNLLQGAG